MLQRALSMYALAEKVLGIKDFKVAGTLDALARVYYAQGKYTQAEPLLQHFLAIREKALGR